MRLQEAARLDDVPQGHWVVLTADHSRVIAHDADLRMALAAAERTGESDLVFMKNEAAGRFLVGSAARR